MNENQNNKKPVFDRRTRPAKSPLSREAIIEKSLELLAKDGLSGFSLRKVAAMLDTGPASLYVYIANLDELYVLLLDHAFGKIDIPKKSDQNWREKLLAILSSYTKTLLKWPGLGQISMTTIPNGPNALALMEEVLKLLLAGGLDPSRAAWALDSLLLYSSSIACEQDLQRDRKDPLNAIDHTLQNISSDKFPNLFTYKKELLAGGERFLWALNVMINGFFITAVDDRQ